MRKLTLSLALCFLLALTLTACSTASPTVAPTGAEPGATENETETEAGGDTPIDYTYFAGKKIGVPAGNLGEQVILDNIGGISVHYPDIYAALPDIRNGTIDGFITDLSIVRVVAGFPNSTDLQAISVPAEYFEGPLGAFSKDQELIDGFNAFLAELEEDGTLADMQNRWLAPGASMAMPELELTGENGTLKVATTGAALPFSDKDAAGNFSGYSVELAERFAMREEMTVEFITMDFAELISYVADGKANLGIDAVTITEERKEQVLFTDAIYVDTLGIIALK